MRRFLIILGWLVFVGSTFAQNPEIPQEVIGPMWQGRAVSNTPIISYSRGGKEKDTLFIRSNQPFFDDFSKGMIPDSAFWDLCASDPARYPSVMRHAAVEPPSLGAAMFDGVSPDNRPYENDLLRGGCDRLESHYIDISNLDADSDVWLTFFLQPQGFGHAPSSRDSFRVYLNAKPLSNPANDSLVLVYSQAGSTKRDFTQITRRISNPAFFHTRFYIVFESYGYQNGVINTWHLDYVNLGLERTPTDTLYRDRSVCYLDKSPFHPYTAIPFQQYQAGQLANGYEIVASNLTGSSSTVSISTEITDPVGGNVFSPPYQRSTSATMDSYGGTNISFNPFVDNQNLTNPYAATFRQEVKITSPADDQPQNDHFVTDFRIDTLMAYDDGEADTGYGLNKARGFGQKFEVRSQDSLMAVWISFAPQVDFFNGGSLEGEIFELVVWDGAHPDSILYAQSAGTKVIYGDTTNHFERYKLTTPVSVSGTIYVGLRQLSNASIGVGMDWSYQNGDKIFWDSVGTWTASRFDATLMIRPEFRNINFNPPPFTGLDEIKEASVLSFFPNPLQGNYVNWDAKIPFRNFEAELFDLQGRKVICETSISSQQIQFEEKLTPGLYFIKYSAKGTDGKRYQGTEKLWVR
jgi:hypothetical protein